MSFQIGDYVSNNWSGHAYYGQVGQITNINASGTGAQVDWDGDGLPDAGGGINPTSSNIVARSENESVIQNGLTDIVSKADLGLQIAIGIAVVCVGWFYARKLVKKGK